MGIPQCIAHLRLRTSERIKSQHIIISQLILVVVNLHIVRGTCIAVLLSLPKKIRLFVRDNKVVIMDIFVVKI